jgi:hypothetical protein
LRGIILYHTVGSVISWEEDHSSEARGQGQTDMTSEAEVRGGDAVLLTLRVAEGP